MEGGEGLLIGRLVGDGLNFLVAMGLEEGLGVSAVGLLFLAVSGDILGMQEQNMVADLLEPPPPAMRGAARFQQDSGGSLLFDESGGLLSGEARPSTHGTRSRRHSDFEDGLCQIDGWSRIVHEDSFCVLTLEAVEFPGTMMPKVAAGGVHYTTAPDAPPGAILSLEGLTKGG